MMRKCGFALLEMLMLENEIYSVKLSLERLCRFLYLESSGFDVGVLQFMFSSECHVKIGTLYCYFGF